MRNISQLVASLMLLATQANAPFTDVAASAQASAQAGETYEVSLQTNTSSAIVIAGQTKPNYDAEVLAPLRAAQADATAKAAALAAAKPRRTRAAVAAKTVVAVPASRGTAAATPQNMQALRYCEAGGIYTRNSGNGYYGAYQFNNSTWGGYGGYARADLAPASVQDAKFMESYNRRGWTPWPACSRKLGLM